MEEKSFPGREEAKLQLGFGRKGIRTEIEELTTIIENTLRKVWEIYDRFEDAENINPDENDITDLEAVSQLKQKIAGEHCLSKLITLISKDLIQKVLKYANEEPACVRVELLAALMNLEELDLRKSLIRSLLLTNEIMIEERRSYQNGVIAMPNGYSRPTFLKYYEYLIDARIFQDKDLEDNLRISLTFEDSIQSANDEIVMELSEINGFISKICDANQFLENRDKPEKFIQKCANQQGLETVQNLQNWFDPTTEIEKLLIKIDEGDNEKQKECVTAIRTVWYYRSKIRRHIARSLYLAYDFDLDNMIEKLSNCKLPNLDSLHDFSVTIQEIIDDLRKRGR